MQVRKFEARTMREALEMVKIQLGPDAVILSAKDLSRRFGLAGEKSVEVTAAISDEAMQKKKFVESRLMPAQKERIQNSPARAQKNVIDSMVNKYLSQNAAMTAARDAKPRRYIDIHDEPTAAALNVPALASVTESASAGERIKNAAQRAWSAMQHQIESAPQPALTAAMAPPEVREEKLQIVALKSELSDLKKVLAQFQKVPQNLMAPSYPGSSAGLPYETSFIFEKLREAGIDEELITEILKEGLKLIPAAKLKNKALIEGWVAQSILKTTEIVPDSKVSKLHFFVGPSGAGKTSMLIKMASHLSIEQNKKIAILSADTTKVGAVDQMKIYTQILNVPFGVIRSQQDWVALTSQLGQFDAVLCDFPSLNLKNLDEISLLKKMIPQTTVGHALHLVLPATAKDADLMELVRRYLVIHPTDLIFSRLDESFQHGNLYNIMRKSKLPLHSFGIGPRIPEDFERSTSERVLDLIFKLTKMKPKG